MSTLTPRPAEDRPTARARALAARALSTRALSTRALSTRALPVVALPLLLAGCGGGSGTTTQTSSTVATSSATSPSASSSAAPSPLATATVATPATSASAGSPATAAASSAVPAASASGGASAPGGGSITQTVAPVEVKTIAPVPVGSRAATQDAQVTVSQLRAATLKATLPGEVSGPGVTVRVQVTNTGSAALDLSGVVVNATGPGNQPGVALTGAPTKPVTGSLAPGASATGSYAFRFPARPSGTVRVDVSVLPGKPVTSFTGTAG